MEKTTKTSDKTEKLEHVSIIIPENPESVMNEWSYTGNVLDNIPLNKRREGVL